MVEMLILFGFPRVETMLVKALDYIFFSFSCSVSDVQSWNRYGYGSKFETVGTADVGH